MVTQQAVDRLTDELTSLRGSVVRQAPIMSERVERVLRDARKLHDESHGTAFEPALRSVENLLGCVQRGLAAQNELNAKRKAG